MQVGKDLPLAAKWPVWVPSRRLGEIASTPTHELVEAPALARPVKRTPSETESGRKRSPRDSQDDERDDQIACEHSVDDGRGENSYRHHENLKQLPANDSTLVAPREKCSQLEAENE